VILKVPHTVDIVHFMREASQRQCDEQCLSYCLCAADTIRAVAQNVDLVCEDDGSSGII
jgi:hypothetical protein